MIHPVYSATVLANGTTTTSVGVTGAGKIGTGPMVAGLYNVTFEKDVSDCAFVAAAGVGGSNATAHVAQGSPKVVNVGVWRPKYSASIGDVFPWGEDGPFTIIAQC